MSAGGKAASFLSLVVLCPAAVIAVAAVQGTQWAGGALVSAALGAWAWRRLTVMS